MAFFRQFYVKCGNCGHRNSPHPSPRKGVELVLRGEFHTCRGCGRDMKNIRLSDRPLVQKIRAELQAKGIPTVC